MKSNLVQCSNVIVLCTRPISSPHSCSFWHFWHGANFKSRMRAYNDRCWLVVLFFESKGKILIGGRLVWQQCLSKCLYEERTQPPMRFQAVIETFVGSLPGGSSHSFIKQPLVTDDLRGIWTHTLCSYQSVTLYKPNSNIAHEYLYPTIGGFYISLKITPDCYVPTLERELIISD